MIFKRKYILFLISTAFLSTSSFANMQWETIGKDEIREVQLNRSGIIQSDGDTKVAWVRIILLNKENKTENEEMNHAAIKALSRFNCAERSITTVKRVYMDEQNRSLRDENIDNPEKTYFSTDSIDERLWREVCRPSGGASQLQDIAQKIQDALKEAGADSGSVHISEPTVKSKKESKTPVRKKVARKKRYNPENWSYQGKYGSDQWFRMEKEWSVCKNGKRQSPVNISNTFRKDVEPLVFDYRPANFRITNTKQNLKIENISSQDEAMEIVFRGKSYKLKYITIQHPGFMIENSKMDAFFYLYHQSDKGEKLLLALPMKKSDNKNPVLEMIFSNLPIKNNIKIKNPEPHYINSGFLDFSSFIPHSPEHYVYSGSLPEPPCTENVVWIVMKNPLPVSYAQLIAMRHLHPVSTRPAQNVNGRLIVFYE